MYFHKNFILENGQKIVDAIRSKLLNSSDQSMRDMKKEQVDAIIKSIKHMNQRLIKNEDERDR